MHHEARSGAATSVLWMDVNLLEMHGIGVEYIDVRETDRDVIGERDRQPALTLCPLQDFVAGRFEQNRRGRVSSKQPRSRKFDLR